MQVWNVLHAARWKYRTQNLAKKSGHHRQLCRAISSQRRHVSTIGKNLLSSNISYTCPRNNFGPLTAEIGSVIWGTPPNLNGFRVLAALLHGTLVLGVNQTLRRHLYSAGRPSRWALSHILFFCFFLFVCHSDISGTAERICAKYREDVFGSWLGKVWMSMSLRPKRKNCWVIPIDSAWLGVRRTPDAASSSRRYHCVAAAGWWGDGNARWRRLECGLCSSSFIFSLVFPLSFLAAD